MSKRLSLLIGLIVVVLTSTPVFAATSIIVVHNTTDKAVYFTAYSTRPVVFPACVKPKSAYTLRWKEQLKEISISVLPHYCGGGALYKASHPSSGKSEENFYVHEVDGRFSLDTRP